ncbi:MAG: hypothetical protein UX28_C0003G0174, partial [Candidatus Pacebacteria bacterium GW2011_GWA1_46_10]
MALTGASTNFTATGNFSVNTDDLVVEKSTGDIGVGTTDPSSRLDVQDTGTAKANADLFEITNDVNALDMDATETSILFNQYYYDAVTPAVADAGRITVGTETDWTSTATTQDAYLSFQTALDGTLTERLRITSAGVFDIGTNTFSDGNFTGNWSFNSGNLSGIANLTASGTIEFSGLGTGTDNTVVILNSSNQLTTDEIDSRVWGTSLVDYSSSTANYIPLFSDADTITNSVLSQSSGNIISGGDIQLSDTYTLEVGGLTGVAYNALANSGEAPEEAAISSDNDLYV